MFSEEMAAPLYRQELAGGLILRWSTREDTENIVELVARVFRNKESDPPNEWLANVTRDLMSDTNPLMGSGDYAIVEDPEKEGNPLVAGVCLQRITLQYEDVSFSAGRPEIVATDPAYRNRGLIRHLFALVHARSQSEGHLIQGITGIPYFYRQFGYEYALDLGGKYITPFYMIPKAKEGETEAYRLRDATSADVPLMLKCYNSERQNNLVWAVQQEEDFRHFYEWASSQRVEGQAFSIQIVENGQGQGCGVMYLPAKRWWHGLDVGRFHILAGTNLHTLLPPLMRGLQAYAEQLPPAKEDSEAFNEIHWGIAPQHPLAEALGSLAPIKETPYAWYVRVADLPGFLQHIAPVLENRLASSVIAGYDGEIKLDFYRGGLRLVFANGKLTTAESWRAPAYEAGAKASFPPLVFTQLLFGYRSLDELRRAFPDVWVDREGELVLKILFPTRPSKVIIPF